MIDEPEFHSGIRLIFEPMIRDVLAVTR
jgi:hypothetical protein